MPPIDPNKVLVMGRSSLIDKADARGTGATNYGKIVHPHRVHSPSPDRDVPPTVAHFTHDANFTRCVPICPGEEGDPFQRQMWETHGLPTPGETMIFMYTVPAGFLLRGWRWDVVEGVPGLTYEIVVATYGGPNGGTLDNPELHVVGEFDASECGMGWFSAPNVLETVGSSHDVWTDHNWRVFVRVKSIDDPKAILCSRFQVHQMSQCLLSQAQPVRPAEIADKTKTYPGLGGQDQASPFGHDPS